MNPTRLRTRLALAFMLSAACAGLAAQPAKIPDGPIRIIIPTTPGTTPDIMARALAPKLGERLNHPIVVENKVGAGGGIGTDSVVRAAPNGSTLLFSASSLTVGAALYPSLPYDPVRDLTPIAFVGWNRLVLVTHPNSGIKSIADLIAAARKSPGRLNYASPGVGTPNHLTAELFKVRTGISMTHIPFAGSGPQVTAVLGGQVDMAPVTANVAAPQVRTGKLVALATAGDKPSPMLPGTPSLSEVNVPGVNGDIWYGIFGPKGMRPELAAQLNKEINEILRMDDVTASFKSQGFDIEPTSQEEFRNLVARDAERWTSLIRTQGIKAD